MEAVAVAPSVRPARPIAPFGSRLKQAANRNGPAGMETVTARRVCPGFGSRVRVTSTRLIGPRRPTTRTRWHAHRPSADRRGGASGPKPGSAARKVLNPRPDPLLDRHLRRPAAGRLGAGEGDAGSGVFRSGETRNEYEPSAAGAVVVGPGTWGPYG